MNNVSSRLFRSTRASTAVVSAVLIFAACGGADSSDDSSGENSGGYPVTVDTAYGEVTLEEKPERIVVLTPQYVDLLTALDEEPTVTNPGDKAGEEDFLEFYEWLEDEYTGDVDAKLLNADFQAAPEVIGSYEPDLILGNVWSVPEEVYGQLSDIARPTPAEILTAQPTGTNSSMTLGR